MKTFKFTLLITAAISLFGLASASPKADVDQDGQITQSEFLSAAAARFDAADSNFDGVLNIEEMQAARKAKADRRAQARFKGLDANSDGMISQSEYDAKRAARAEKRKARKDVNGDGVIDEADRAARKERREARKNERGERRAADGKNKAKRGPKRDANGDGVITRAEHEAASLALFERLDRNQDGVLTKGEGRRGKKGRKGKKRGQ
jgi:Ca2+-binding EF-hand superfamily protein